MVFKVKFNPLAPDYKAPISASSYMKMAKAGAPIKFILVGQIITGFSYWTEDKRCLRFREKPTETPGIKMEDGKPDRVSHFWVLPVFDCGTESVKLLEISQRGIQDQLSEIFQGDDYDLGDLESPMAVKISATGEKLLTKYTLMPVPVNYPGLLSKLEGDELLESNLDAFVFDPKPTTGEATPAVESTANPLKTVASAQDMM
jgi:hypothetical protein